MEFIIICILTLWRFPAQTTQYRCNRKTMLTNLPKEFRKYQINRIQLYHILCETRQALELIDCEDFFPEENIIEQLLPPLTLERITYILENEPRIIIFGQDSRSKASLVNKIISADILPVQTGSWKWIKISHGQTNHISLSLGLEYEVVDVFQTNEKSWETLQVEDLKKLENEDTDCPSVLEVKLDQAILKDGVEIFVVPNDPSNVVKILSKNVFKISPIFFYALGDEPLTEDNLEELRNLKETYPLHPVLFISSLLDVPSKKFNTELNESEQYRFQSSIRSSDSGLVEDYDAIENEHKTCLTRIWCKQLINLGFFRIKDDTDYHPLSTNIIDYDIANDFLNSSNKTEDMYKFVKNRFRDYLVDASNYLNDIHTSSLRKFIISAFDMAREIQITPRRIQYAQKKETELYSSLMNTINQKQEELTELIHNIIEEMKNEITIDTNLDSNVTDETMIFINDNERREWAATLRVATLQIQRLVLERLGEKVAKQLVNSINCLRETFVGTLQRCLLSLEKPYEHDVSSSASNALKQILSAAYNIELHNASPSLVHSFLERLRQLLKSLPHPWSSNPILDVNWKKKISIDILDSLCSARLAKTISTQFRDKVKSWHDSFQTALRSLENHYSGKLERTEEQRIAIRKFHTPKLAKLALESKSMIDIIRFGIPQCGKEIGRGQYGVVFSCENWGGAPGPCAVKSVVPPDERHWNDLAMEFYYTRSIPDHKRIVKLRGSVIDPTYTSGSAVLLITDRMTRDLYCALRNGLTWPERIQISIDVLEGIRYLHSQGLVHRDIKLKNVLLDTENRAKITDLGFCITEAMMSGSIVGTPVHMAPELLSGQYDSSVDVYAFGILFWYLCAGHVRLPYAFEVYHNKEQLWVNVRKGIRPERLSYFDDECWELMGQCWTGDPSKRPLLGAIIPVLRCIQDKVELGKFSDREGKFIKLENNNPALKLDEPLNQRGVVAKTIPVKRKKLSSREISAFNVGNFFQTTVCYNLFIQLREF